VEGMANPFANSVKFLKAINLLASPQGTTIKGLMEELNISRRSIFRLLYALDELGFPILDEQSIPRGEKRYRLIESYVVQLPNIAIPTINFSEPESELLLSMLDFCIDIQKPENAILLNGIRQKIKATKGV
jgi:predicted DNA-binding transcriptional regulator YafY